MLGIIIVIIFVCWVSRETRYKMYESEKLDPRLRRRLIIYNWNLLKYDNPKFKGGVWLTDGYEQYCANCLNYSDSIHSYSIGITTFCTNKCQKIFYRRAEILRRRTQAISILIKLAQTDPKSNFYSVPKSLIDNILEYVFYTRSALLDK